MEGLEQGDEQEVDGAGKSKNTASTVESWGYDWLNFEKDKKGYVTKVWCCICREHYKNCTAQHIYIHNTDTYITGSTNVKKYTDGQMVSLPNYKSVCHGCSKCIVSPTDWNCA